MGNQIFGIRHIFHQIGTRFRFNHLINRTTHIKINDVTIRLRIQILSCIHHRFDIMSKDLKTQRMFIRTGNTHCFGFLRTIEQSFITDHFIADKTSTQLFRNLAKGNIGNPCHWRNHYIIRTFNISNFKLGSHVYAPK